jgi:putative methionine-R-sulfoxide reductase with GAF domain
MSADLRRYVVRHRHVAPMLASLLAGTNARIRITDLDGEVILHREAGSGADGAPGETFPILVEGQPVGWIEGPRPAGAIAAVLSYAVSREQDKRSLAQEALDRYRELNLIYDLAEQIGAVLEVAAVARVAAAEAGRLPGGGVGFVLLREGDERLVAAPAGEPGPIAEARAGVGVVGAVLGGDPEIVNDVAADPRATTAERRMAALAVAPLRVRGERIGVVGTASETPTEYRAADLKILTAIAALAAPTLDQAAIHEAALAAADRPA